MLKLFKKDNSKPYVETTRFLWFLAYLILASGVWDIVTFFMASEFRVFEVNPIYVLTKSLFLLLAFKIFFLLLFCYYIIYRVKYFKKNHWRYFYSIIAFYLIALQFVGGWTNLDVLEEKPDASLAMEKEEALETVGYLSLIFVYIPLFVQILIFKMYEWSFKPIKHEVNG